METACVLWTGAKYGNGYGQSTIDGKKTGAHRVAWILERGKIPRGLEIDHLCNVRACVNVEHMQLVTRQENMALARVRRELCRSGRHKLTLEPGPCLACRKLYSKSEAFLAAQKRWLEKNAEHRRAYAREWMRRKRAAGKGVS